MSEVLNINNDAERKILCKIVNSPNIIFDIDNIIRQEDFYTAVAKNVFISARDISSSNSNLSSNDKIDSTILEEKVASLFPEYYKSQSEIVKTAIKKIYEENVPSDKDFIELIKIVVNNSIKRKYLIKIEEIKSEIDPIKSPDKLIKHIECSTSDFTSGLFRSNEISTLGQNYEDWLSRKYNEALSGKIHVGIKCGFPNYEKSIGGGFRDGTINIIAARSKMGKSFMALTFADYVASNGIPVLYLDTELDDEYQTIRRASKITKIPLIHMEYAQFIGDANKEKLTKDAIESFKKNKIYYVDIKGWSLDEQISIIRRFFSKIVGKNKDGRFNRCLVILDYLKLMSSSDKNSDKEYEALGYRMTALHDLMGEFQSPMFALVQQNRDGLEKEDESTVSGSDRIIYLCDNFTIFSRLSDEEIAMRYNANNGQSSVKPENCKLKVVCCRHGPGTKGKKFIGVYADIHDPTLKEDQVCGIIEERSIQTVVISK